MLKYSSIILFGLLLSHGVYAAETNREDSSTVPFQVPAGFVAERIAGSPLVEHPMFADFDEQGRLFVADSLGVNLVTRKEIGLVTADLVGVANIPRVREALEEPPMVIRRLEECDDGGQFEKSTVFADGLTYPQGVLWHDGALYTVSPPGLWRLEDTNDDGIADRRDELISGTVFTGAADDAHGPCLGPDGLLYWCHGRFGHELVGRDGTVVARGPGPRIYRCRPDGSQLEMLSAAMGNPVEVAFTAEGEALACGTFFFREGNGPLRDAMIHGIEGGVFPVRTRSDTEKHRTGELLPELVRMSATSPSGLTRYRGDLFGPEYENNLFVALFNTHAVQRVVLERQGATFQARAEDFLVSTDPDFHPTDVLQDADGSLIVVDTGTWFANCPTAGLGKAPVKGGIYRIRRAEAAKVEDPRGLRIDWGSSSPAELAKLLDDPRWAVSDRAVEQLAQRGNESLPALQNVPRADDSARARRNALWTLARIEGDQARGIARSALADPGPSVRLTSVNVAGLHRDEAALPTLQELLNDDDPAIRREAATALGRIARVEAVPALLNALRAGGDRFLEHALIYALIRIDHREATLEGLADPSPMVRRAALVALDQMDHGELTRELVAPHLGDSDPAVQKTALEIVASRPGWAEETVGLLRGWLAEPDLPPERLESLSGALLAFIQDETIQGLVAQALAQPQTSVSVRLALLETIARAPLDTPPTSWQQQLGRQLDENDERLVHQTIVCLGTFQLEAFDEPLTRLACDAMRSSELRIAALGVVAPRLARLESELFDFVVTRLAAEQLPLERMAAAKTLGSAALDEQQLTALAGAIARAGALEMPDLLAPYERSSSPAVGRALLAALAQSPGLSSLTPERLHQTLAPYSREIQTGAEPLIKLLSVDSQQQKARLDELVPALDGGDPQRGREVFFGKTASCAACHTIRSEGGQVGPDLSKIGEVRSARDLLEAVVFPSASFARGYEPYLIATIDGKIYTGVLRRETAQAIHLVGADRAEVRLRREEIETVEPARVSVMPQGLDTQLSQQELSDLIAYLSSRK